MWKWIGWAARLVAAALLVSFLSIWTTGYIVTSYVQSALKEYGITLDEQPFAMSGVWGKMWGADGAKTAAKTEVKTGTAADDEDNGRDQAAAAPESEAATASGMGGEEAASPEPDEAAGAPTPAPGPAPSDAGQGEQAGASPEATPGDGAVPVWSEEDVASAAAGLTDEEKQQIYSVVVSKLSSAQLGELTELIKGGLTQEELPKLESLLKPVLSDEEYATMMEALQVPAAQ